MLQAVLAAYSPGAPAGGPSPTLVCLVCKKDGKTGAAIQHMYRQCPLLLNKNPEEKGKLIGEARSHYGKAPSRHAPGSKGKYKGKKGEGEDDGAQGAVTVSYTHLTLPTTPYV